MTYTMRCVSCGWRGEVERPMGDTDSATCPTCAKPLVVVIAPVPRVWKGGKP